MFLTMRTLCPDIRTIEIREIRPYLSFIACPYTGTDLQYVIISCNIMMSVFVCYHERMWQLRRKITSTELRLTSTVIMIKVFSCGETVLKTNRNSEFESWSCDTFFSSSSSVLFFAHLSLLQFLPQWMGAVPSSKNSKTKICYLSSCNIWSLARLTWP